MESDWTKLDSAEKKMRFSSQFWEKERGEILNTIFFPSTFFAKLEKKRFWVKKSQNDKHEISEWDSVHRGGGRRQPSRENCPNPKICQQNLSTGKTNKQIDLKLSSSIKEPIYSTDYKACQRFWLNEARWLFLSHLWTLLKQAVFLRHLGQ